MDHARVIGRILAACGWLAWRVERVVRIGPLRRLPRGRVGLGAALVIGVVGLVPLVLGLAQRQPQDVTVEEIFGHAVTEPDGWVRLRGLTVPLDENPTSTAESTAKYGVLVDAANELDAVVLQAAETVAEAESTILTGHLLPATVLQASVEEQLPLEATVFGAPPTVVPDAIVVVDATPFPERVVLWLVTLGLALVAIVLALGALVGYPVFRPAREIDVLARPLGPGERIPAAVGGRIGDHQVDLADPVEALLLAGHGPRGPVLTVQIIPSHGPAPRPVSIGGGWTRAQVGYLHVIGETVAALAVEAEQADAVLLFARRSERDRAAAMVATAR